MSRNNSALLVVDVQEKLLPHINEAAVVEWNIGRLLDGADTLGVKTYATEQYPKGLGMTVPGIRSKLVAEGEPLPEKTMFSCRECTQIASALRESKIRNVVIVGIETHVCVGQTAMDFMSAGFDIHICVDAAGSRSKLDHDTAIRRLENCGAVPVTTESVLFEWCEAAGSAEFKTISKLVQQTQP